LVGGTAFFEGAAVMIIAQQKGRDTKENIIRNFGMPQPEGYRKALRLMKMAEKFGLPVITFIDTPGAYPGIESEARHVSEAIAVNLREMAMLKVPSIAVVVGEGGSGGALGIGVTDRVLIFENSYYSVISPRVAPPSSGRTVPTPPRPPRPSNSTPPSRGTRRGRRRHPRATRRRPQRPRRLRRRAQAGSGSPPRRTDRARPRQSSSTPATNATAPSAPTARSRPSKPEARCHRLLAGSKNGFTSRRRCVSLANSVARVAELADAVDSKSTDL
jgi:hypothetical protein